MSVNQIVEELKKNIASFKKQVEVEEIGTVLEVGDDTVEVKATGGDTHLGQFPAPVRFERFYKAGEHGPPIEIKDARYVLFRIPPATTASGAGKTVLDKERPTASTPYSNLPLKEERITAAPDERQLVPPRYRDLLR